MYYQFRFTSNGKQRHPRESFSKHTERACGVENLGVANATGIGRDSFGSTV
jgi:hypothetical protein